MTVATGKLGRRGSLMAARQLRPLRQGELDGLCGIYAAVNALRLVLARDGYLTGPQIDALYHCGVAVIDAEGQLPAAVKHGVSQSLWKRAVRKMCRVAAEASGQTVRRRLPFAGDRRPGRKRLFAAIEAAIDRQQPVLVALSGAHSHYSVICGYSPARLMLFDSSAHRWLDRVGCGPKPGKRTWRHRISTRSLTILELAPC